MAGSLFNFDYTYAKVLLMDAFQILVVILSVFLGIFLILGIVLLIMCIKVSRKINRITANIEDASESLREGASGLSRLVVTLNQLASPAVIARVVVKYVRHYITKRRTQNDR